MISCVKCVLYIFLIARLCEKEPNITCFINFGQNLEFLPILEGY
jgi:hypothetical protein